MCACSAEQLHLVADGHHRTFFPSLANHRYTSQRIVPEYAFIDRPKEDSPDDLYVAVDCGLGKPAVWLAQVLHPELLVAELTVTQRIVARDRTDLQLPKIRKQEFDAADMVDFDVS